jgi:hypothetical protein
VRYVAAGLVGAAVLLVGCGNEPDRPGAGQEPSVSTAPSGPVEQAKTDLAGRLGVPVEQVSVVSTEEVTWPDSSLGCPQPGMNYAQVLTEGTRTILSAGGRQYSYHSGPRRPPFLCENPRTS